jgi:hypothetical protein
VHPGCDLHQARPNLVSSAATANTGLVLAVLVPSQLPYTAAWTRRASAACLASACLLGGESCFPAPCSAAHTASMMQLPGDMNGAEMVFENGTGDAVAGPSRLVRSDCDFDMAVPTPCGQAPKNTNDCIEDSEDDVVELLDPPQAGRAREKKTKAAQANAPPKLLTAKRPKDKKPPRTA